MNSLSSDEKRPRGGTSGDGTIQAPQKNAMKYMEPFGTCQVLISQTIAFFVNRCPL